jgi:hypothetical protein
MRVLQDWEVIRLIPGQAITLLLGVAGNHDQLEELAFPILKRGLNAEL